MRGDTPQPKAETAIYRPTVDREFARKAANGWKSFQIDEGNRAARIKDPGYQRWMSMSGYGEVDDPICKPARNWSVNENNTFGYLYGQNKQSAYDYAKNLNTLLSKQVKDIGSALREDAEERWEDIKDFGRDVWGNYKQAQEANSQAHQSSGENIGAAWSTVGQKIKAGAQASAQTELAQAEQTQEQSKEAKKIGEKTWEYLRGNVGVINDAISSDQVGSGVHGFLKSALIDEQNEIDNVDKQKAILAESVTDNIPSMLGGTLGARVANFVQPLDLLRSGWEFGAAGHVDLSGGEFYQIKNTIDDAISTKLGESLPRVSDDVPYIGGMGADDIYEIITSTIDDGIALKMPGGIAYKGICAASETFHSCYEEAKRIGDDDKLAIKYATKKAFGAGLLDVLDSVDIKDLNLKNVDDTIAKIISEGLKSGMFEAVGQGNNTLENRSSKSESEETAESWRNGFLGGVLQGSVEDILNRLKK